MFAGKLYSSRADNKQNLEVRYQKAVKFLCHYPNIGRKIYIKDNVTTILLPI